MRSIVPHNHNEFLRLAPPTPRKKNKKNAKERHDSQLFLAVGVWERILFFVVLGTWKSVNLPVKNRQHEADAEPEYDVRRSEQQAFFFFTLSASTV